MRRFESREARFSNRVLMTYAASSLPEVLGLKGALADAPAEILLYDEIGFWGVTAGDFAFALKQAGDGPLTLRINSPGGDVFDGYAIYNMLRARKTPVNVVVDGLAASAASFIAMAGSTITMAEASMLMIHNSWGLCIGDRHDMLDMAATQEKIDGQIAAIYAGKCGTDVPTLAKMMDDETWLTSGEALEQKLCDVVLAPPAAGASNAARSSLANGLKPLARLGARIRDAVSSENPARNAVAPYDPDGDGDNDAEEAISQLTAAQTLIAGAIACLNGTDTDADDAADPKMQGTRRPRAERAPPKVTVAPPELVADANAVAARLAAMQRRLRLAEAEQA